MNPDPKACANQFGLFCPQCHASDQLDITAAVAVRLKPDGTDADQSEEGDHIWSADSPIHCAACGWRGVVLNAGPVDGKAPATEPARALLDVAHPTIYPYLDLSTSHLKEATVHLLDEAAETLRAALGGTFGDWPAMTIAPYTYGVFVTVPDAEELTEHGQKLPADLAKVLWHAHRLGVPLLRFDKDADEVPGLPSYAW